MHHWIIQRVERMFCMKRTIALILAVAMALALVPATALAADPHIVASVSSADFSVGDTVGKADITVTYYDSVGNDAPVTDFTINGGDSVQLTAAGKKTLQIGRASCRERV